MVALTRKYSKWLLLCRETEASSNLSLTLTGTCLALLVIVRALGLALAQVDELQTKYGPMEESAPKANSTAAKVE